MMICLPVARPPRCSVPPTHYHTCSCSLDTSSALPRRSALYPRVQRLRGRSVCYCTDSRAISRATNKAFATTSFHRACMGPAGQSSLRATSLFRLLQSTALRGSLDCGECEGRLADHRSTKLISRQSAACCSKHPYQVSALTIDMLRSCIILSSHRIPSCQRPPNNE